MSQDLSQAFGRPATSSLRGLLPPRDGGTRWSDPSDEAPRPKPEDLEAVEDGSEPDGFEDDEPEDTESEDDELDDDGFEDDEPEDDEPGDSELQDDELEDDELEDDELEDDELEDDEPEDTEPEEPEPEEPEAATVAPRRAENPRRAARRTPAASGRRTAPATTAPTPAPTPSWRGRVRVTSREHVDLLVLLTLRPGPTDGRGVIARLRESSGGTLEVSERTVHVTLHRLARNRLLGRRLGPVSGRRLYALTEAGRRAARARLRQVQALARGVDAVARTAE